MRSRPGGPGWGARVLLAAVLALLGVVLISSVRTLACTTDYLVQLQALRHDLDAGGDVGSDITRLGDIIRSNGAGSALTPVITNLEAGDLTSAKHRLDAIINALQVPANTVCNADTGGARDALHRVYQSPVFADLDKPVDQGPSLLQRIVEAVAQLVGGLMNTLGPGGTILLAALILGLVVGFALWRLAQVSGSGRHPAPTEPGAQSVDPDTEWHMALEAAASGDHREAIRRAFRSALLSVATRGRLPISAAWTTRELLTQARPDPDLATLLAPAAAGFDHAWYSGEPITSADWEVARSRCQEIRALAGQRSRAAA